eukprot:4172743-Pyramimonas_sp.AAC.1
MDAGKKHGKGTGSATSTAREQQTCARVGLFFTAGDWKVLADTSISVQSKIEILATRLWRDGISCPSTPLLKRVVGIMCLAGLPEESVATPELKRNWMLSVKAAIKALDQNGTFPGQHIKRYVTDPKLLPKLVHDFGHEDAEPVAPPAHVTASALDELMAVTGFRGPHKTLKPQHTTSLSPTSSQLAVVAPHGAPAAQAM